MVFIFKELSLWQRMRRNCKGSFIFFVITIILDLLFTGTLFSIAIVGFMSLLRGLLIFFLRSDKFYIEKLIMTETTLRMKVYRFNELILDTKDIFDLKKVKMENIPTSASYYQKDNILRIVIGDMKISQLSLINGWTKEMFDEIISYLKAHQ